MSAVLENTMKTSNLADLRKPVEQQHFPTVHAGFGSLAGFELLQRGAKALAASTLVPAQYQGNLPNCMIALNMACRLRADELMVMQNLYIVHGNPGWSSKFLIASVNTCGRYSSIRYEWRGTADQDDFGCRAWAIEKATGERLDGIWIDWKMVKAEGWSKKNGSKWLTMPDQMFIYRAAAFWQRAYAPEISMGLPTVEELGDTFEAGQDANGRFVVDGVSDFIAPTTTVKNADVVENDLQLTQEAPSATEVKPAPAKLYQEALALAQKGNDLCLDLLRDLPKEMAAEIRTEFEANQNKSAKK